MVGSCGGRSMQVQTLPPVAHPCLGHDFAVSVRRRSVSLRSQQLRLRQKPDNSPLRFSWTTLAIRCAPRMVQLISRFFI